MRRSRDDDNQKLSTSDADDPDTKRIALLETADRLLTTVLGPHGDHDKRNEASPTISQQRSMRVHQGPKYLIGMSSANLMNKENSIFQVFIHMNNCFYEMEKKKDKKGLLLRDHAEEILGKEANQAMKEMFNDTHPDNPTKCLQDNASNYLTMKSQVHGFARLLRDVYISTNNHKGLTRINCMQYLLDEEKLTAELIPNCLRFIHIFMKHSYSNWFGRYFISLEPLFLVQNESESKKESIVELFLRFDEPNLLKGADTVYDRILFDINEEFDRFIMAVSLQMDIRFFTLQGLSQGKRFKIENVSNLTNGLEILVQKQHEELEKTIKEHLRKYSDLDLKVPKYEDAVSQMDSKGLFDENIYPAEIALQDVVLFFVDKFKFAARLLQASDSIKERWLNFIGSVPEPLNDSLVVFAKMFLVDLHVDLPNEHVSPLRISQPIK